MSDSRDHSELNILLSMGNKKWIQDFGYDSSALGAMLAWSVYQLGYQLDDTKLEFDS
jgi:hypothetical protein